MAVGKDKCRICGPSHRTSPDNPYREISVKGYPASDQTSRNEKRHGLGLTQEIAPFHNYDPNEIRLMVCKHLLQTRREGKNAYNTPLHRSPHPG